MANSRLLRAVGGVVEPTIAGSVNLVRYMATQPLLTGSILMAWKRAPLALRARLKALLQDQGITGSHVAVFIRGLKIFGIVGVIYWLNEALNRLALNHWHLKKLGAPFGLK